MEEKYTVEISLKDYNMIERALHMRAKALEAEDDPKAREYRHLAYRIEDTLFPLPACMKP